MGFAIATNSDALNTYRNLNAVQTSLSKSLERLSSGLRINQAGDDAAGLTISTRLGAQISGLTQASRNAQDGVSMVQTADGALTQAQSLLQRLRDLAVQAANDSNTTAARQSIAKEATSITSELTRLGNSVSFNGKKLLDGTAGTLSFQVGENGDANNVVGVTLTSANLVQVASNLGSAGTLFNVTTPTTVTGAMGFSNGNGVTATVTLGAAGTYKTVQQVADALNANSQFANSFTASINGSNQLVVSSQTGGTVVGTGTGAVVGTGVSASAGSATGLDFTTATGAQAAIGAIDGQLDVVSGVRADIGAAENRLASAISTISTSVTNLTSAKSRITDVDMAQEMVNYTRANVLAQSGTAMLAQANSLPQLALKLLQ